MFRTDKLEKQFHANWSGEAIKHWFLTRGTKLRVLLYLENNVQGYLLMGLSDKLFAGDESCLFRSFRQILLLNLLELSQSDYSTRIIIIHSIIAIAC